MNTEQTSHAPTSNQIVFAGFWRRFLAGSIDLIILGLIGSVIGFCFFDALAKLGNWGLLIGLVIALFYYGIQNSVFGKGQTCGKKILKIKVVNAGGDYISLRQSIIRYLLFLAPFVVLGNGLDTEGFSVWQKTIVTILTVAEFFTFYLLIFNRHGRRGLHDLLSGTFVVKTASAGTMPPLSFWKGHYVFPSILIILTGLTFTLPDHLFPELAAMQTALLQESNVREAGVMSNKTWNSQSGSTQTLEVTVTLKNRPEDKTAETLAIASALFQNHAASMAQYDNVVVMTVYGYNIGIATGSSKSSYAHSPKVWRNILENKLEP